jgi:putative ABC transport system permease protein
MLKSILITSFRNFLRNRSFSLINLLGLSVSMSLGLLIILVIKEQYTYDNFHRDSDRIYRVNTRAIREGGSEDYASSPMPVATALKDNYSIFEDVVRMNARFSGDVTYANINVPVDGLLVDPSFLQVFNFPLERGNPVSALNEPNSIVLTRSAAKKIFGDQDGIGKTISISGFGEFTVTAVLQEFPSKTHLEFEMLGSLNLLASLEQRGIVSPSTDNWNNYYANYTYVKLKKGTQVSELTSALQSIYKKHYTGLKLETRDRGYEFFPMSLADLTPGPEMSNQMGSGMPELLIYFMSALVAIVMIMACFNYTNLMIAKSISRAREIGVRKIVGAQRFQVFIQFIGEAVVFALISLAFSYLILQFLKPAFLQLNIANEFDSDLKEDFTLYIVFFAFAVLVGFVAGLMPAGYLSAFRPAKVLKDSGNVKVYSRLTMRKVLVVSQFTLSIAFIIVVMVIYRQVNFMVSKDYGFSEQNILNVRLQGMEFEKLASEVRSLPGVISVGGVSHRLGTWADRSSDYKRNLGDEPFVMRDFVVDENYISSLQLTFLSGKNFDPAREGERERHVILNEEALKRFNFSDPLSALGQAIYTDDSTMLTVTGVVKNFHFRPLSYQIGPVALRYNKANLQFLSALIAPAQKESVVASIQSIWKKLDPVHPVEWKMMEDEIDEAYEQAGFFDVLKVVGYVSFIAISLACLGILGMAMYSTKTRLKEIGVRKVMGATSSQITLLLSRSFLILLMIAAVIGAPIGWYFGNSFLTTYAYKIQITPLLLLSGILGVGILGMAMIWSQTWKAASENPVRALRYE